VAEADRELAHENIAGAAWGQARMFVFIAAFAVFGFAGPALNAIMSKLVGPKE